MVLWENETFRKLIDNCAEIVYLTERKLTEARNADYVNQFLSLFNVAPEYRKL